MNFQQLRIIRETVRRNFNLTEVAQALVPGQQSMPLPHPAHAA